MKWRLKQILIKLCPKLFNFLLNVERLEFLLAAPDPKDESAGQPMRDVERDCAADWER